MIKVLSPWKRLTIVSNRIEAEILKGYLESCGIRTTFRSESIGQVHGLTSGPLAEVEVFVSEEQHGEAKKRLEELKSNGGNGISDHD